MTVILAVAPKLHPPHTMA